VRVAIILVAICAAAAPADNRSNQIETATFIAQCDSFKIRVVGSGIDKPNPIVGYNIQLKPPSGTALIITDSFPVIANKDGTFGRTFTNSWKTLATH
jgi:hypothetical protein